MLRYFVFFSLFFLFITPNVWGQEGECEQFKTTFEFVKLNYIEKDYKRNVKFSIYPEVQESLGIPFLISEFYAYQMGIPITEFQKMEIVNKDSIYRMNSENLMKIDTIYSIDCFKYKNHKRPKIEILFKRIDSSTLGVWLINIQRNRRNNRDGQFLILIFDNKNQIKKVFETSWME